jgi:hypothetical protein
LPEPPLVSRARELGLDHDDLGPLLYVLAAQRGRTRVAAIDGHAGAAWIVSALPPEVPFVDVEGDRAVTRAVAELFGEDEHVTVLEGDWRELLPPRAPFDLIFCGGACDDELVGLLMPGGTAVLGSADREFWLQHPEVTTIELQVGPKAAALVAVRG